MPSGTVEINREVSADALSALATRRGVDLFEQDLQRSWDRVEENLSGRRILVLGGAGSIGAATTALLSQFGPAALHVVDQNENSLAELVRDLRSRPSGLSVGDFRALPLDLGSSLMRRFLDGERPYDWVLNFAALKHVRSEKDVFSLLQMLDTNLVRPARCWRWIVERSPRAAYFSVSTDKAADPENLMGASKRIMEHLVFSQEGSIGPGNRVTSARFANVAFSSGSLLESFERRLSKRQPLVCPVGVRRFFISIREAGQLCTLAAVCGPNRHIVVPRLDPEKDQQVLADIAMDFLRYHGLEPVIYACEERARGSVPTDLAKSRYPLLLTPLDTTGEKDREKFVAEGEATVEFDMSMLVAIRYRSCPAGKLPEFIGEIDRLIRQPDLPLSKSDLERMMTAVVPEMRHTERAQHLDQRM
ncbi:MAG: polysaccharide biosynthesis protein [Acidobacteriia bacterium]|nr:polysaccharide biosynthesis protein [Terriglobia bacterium]MBV8903676.1 polysaccharide biosynthesis protein [Terriglobia bacterium]